MSITASPPSDLYFAQLPVGRMANLAYLVGSRRTREALVVDPAWDVDTLLDRADADGMSVVGALVTHYHPDHVGGSLFGMEIEGVPRLLARTPMKIHVNEHEADGLMQVTGASASDLVRHAGGDVIALGDLRVRLLHTPGHTPGSQCFLVETAEGDSHLVSGDTLFLGGCGRVDLPGSDPAAMHASLRSLASLPDATRLYPGHLYASEASGALGDEKRTNPYLRVARLEEFLRFIGA